jgi:hypothetical protein
MFLKNVDVLMDIMAGLQAFLRVAKPGSLSDSTCDSDAGQHA